MNEETELRLYKAGIEEEFRHMMHTWDEMRDNPESDLKTAAKAYLDALREERNALALEESRRVIERVKDKW